ncbi:MAG: hypothetical protein KJ734_09200, partial [Chloroflexi bacterium]|nr:hypothetical protein [Chloroflexota bacterium]
ILSVGVAWWNVLQLPANLPPHTIWEWSPIPNLHVGLTYRVDELGLWLVQIALLLALILLATQGSPRTSDYAWGLAALAMLVSAAFALDLIAFLASWIVLDVALFAMWVGSIRREDALQDGAPQYGAPQFIIQIAASMIVTVALLWAVLMVGSFAGTLLLTRAAPILLTDRTLGMFLLAATFRMMLYPFHLRYHWAAQVARPLDMLGHLIPFLAGFYLLARLYALASGEMPGLQGVQTLAILSLLAGAVLIWHSRSAQERLSWAFLGSIGGLVLVFIQGSPQAIASAGVGLLSLTLAISLLSLQADERPDRTWLEWVLLLVPLASLAGVPPLLGFWAQWMAYNTLVETGQTGAYLLLLACHASMVIALVRVLVPGFHVHGWQATDRRATQLVRWGILGLGAGLLVLPGLWPPALLAWLQNSVALVAGVSNPVLSITALSPAADPLIPWLTIVSLLLALGAIIGLGGWLHLPSRFDPAHRESLARAVERFGDVADLAWLYRWGWRLVLGLAQLAATLMSALDGHYAVAWVILMGMVLALFLLSGTLIP